MDTMTAALKLLLLAILGVLSSTWVPAQAVAKTPETQGIRPNGPFGLLQIAEVRQDLRLTPDQTAKVLAILPRLDREFEARYAAAWRQKDEESFDTMVRIGREFEQAGNTRAIALLDPAQRGRLRQLGLQSLGFHALRLQEVQRTIGMSPSQTATVEELGAYHIAHRGDSVRPYIQSSPSGPPFPSTAKFDAEMEAKVMAVLTPEQTKRYLALLGKPLKAVANTAPDIFYIRRD